MPRVALISDLGRAFDGRADPRNVDMVRRRHAFWAQLARLHGWDLGICDTATLDAPQAAVGGVAWIDLPMLPRARYRAVFAQATAAGATCVLQSPEEMERVLGLDQSYAVLTVAGVPTPRTGLLPVEDSVAAAIDSPAAVRRLLIESMYGSLLSAGIDPHAGVFVRGYYSSAKSANPELFFGRSQEDLEATAFEVIRRLRVALDVGGLALREHLDLERIELSGISDSRTRFSVPFEIRVTVMGGRLLMASYQGPFETLVDEARRLIATALDARSDAVLGAVRAIAPALLRADLPPSYVADIAFPRGGQPVVLELNPLYSAGYNVPAAHALLVASLGADLARRAGYQKVPWSQVLDSAAALVGERVERSSGVWLFDPTATNGIRAFG